jgi:tetratricopeptide (TPR) repeat protein
MANYNKLFYDKFLFFYYNSLIIVYQEKDNNRALITLNEFEQINRKNKNIFYEQFIYTNRALIYFYMKKYDEAIRTLTKLYVTDYYAQADKNFKLKVEISEAIMQYESGDNITAEKRVKQIRKAYKDLLKDSASHTDKEIIDILQGLALVENKKTDTKTVKKINNLIAAINEEKELVNNVVNYHSWLESLKKRKNI